MKKLLNTSMFYMILALVAGVFYREFTKLYDFTGVTTLGVVHTHLFVLGVIVFLILALFAKDSRLIQMPLFKKFYILYNISLLFMTMMFIIRGVVQVQLLSLTSPINSAISGIAGLSHIFMAVSLIVLFVCLKRISHEEDA